MKLSKEGTSLLNFSYISPVILSLTKFHFPIMNNRANGCRQMVPMMQRDWWLKSNNIKKLVNKKDIYFLPFICSAFLIQYSYQKNFYIHIPLLEYIPEMIYQKTYWWHFFSESFGSNILVYLLWNPSVCKKVSKKLVEKNSSWYLWLLYQYYLLTSRFSLCKWKV